VSAIEITGLTTRQRAIADVLWMMNGKDAVLSFINSLEAETRKDAYTVLNMMVAAVMDEINEVDDLVKSEIDRIKNI
jgi:hypothetical protein